MNNKAKFLGVVSMLALSTSAFSEFYLSPCDSDLYGDSIYITASTGKAVLRFDTKNDKVQKALKFPDVLTGLAINDKETLFVTGGGYYGKVWQTDRDGKIQKTIELGHTPMSPVLSPDQKMLYVCNRFNNNVAFVDLASSKVTATVPVIREPVAMDITPDGKTLFVANHNPAGAADLDYVASRISVIDVATKTATDIMLVNGSEGVRGMKVSPDGKYAYATHFMARFLVPTTQLERGWVSTDALSVIRVADKKLLYTILLDDVDQGFPNPWAIDFSEDAKTLIVSSAGHHEVSLIDLKMMTDRIEEEAAASEGAAHLNAHNNLSFLTGMRKRIDLNGNGPRSIAVKGNIAYVANYFSDSIDMVNMSAQRLEKSIELNPNMKITKERQGEIFFNDADLCFQNWLSCATCHPDARTDAMNWDLLNDGMGNPKNVKSMLLTHETPRAMWLGVRADGETGVRAGIRHIQFAVRPEADAEALDAYLKSLKAEPSPYLVNGKLSESGKRGKKLFEEMSCASCHPAPLFTDMEMYEVGTTKGQDVGRPVDTPSLIECWRTAQYLHDGRAATMRDVLTKFDHADILSETKKLSEKELTDLETYILSL